VNKICKAGNKGFGRSTKNCRAGKKGFGRSAKTARQVKKVLIALQNLQGR
jgi:hypothetical protein